MFSPTGYVAVIHVMSFEGGKRSLPDLIEGEALPIIRWNDDGKPVVSNEWGELVTPQELVDQYTGGDEAEPEHTYRGSFEVHAAPSGDWPRD